MLELEVSRERIGKWVKQRKLDKTTRTSRALGTQVIPHLWEHRDQEITSLVTSINSKKLPALFNFKKVQWAAGTRNLDIGAGKYHENVTAFLRDNGVESWPFDPFSLTREENLEAIRNAHSGQCNTVTVTNCVNVIKDPFDREILFLRVYDALKPGGVGFFQFHEGDRSGQGRVSQMSKDGKPLAWQENRKTRDYLRDIEGIFHEIVVRGNVITARKRY